MFRRAILTVLVGAVFLGCASMPDTPETGEAKPVTMEFPAVEYSEE